jgi:tyrosine decarboxylase/aspartate 1-decarboxylase
LQPKGSNRKALLAELKRIRGLDQRYDNGRILCSMCTKPHPVAKEAYRMFLSSNLGDKGLFPGSAQLEKEVINQLAALLHDANAAGLLASGGTEANLIALLAARNTVNARKPEVILPESAHFSFTKICNLLNVKPVYTTLDDTFKVDLTEVERHINKNTIAVVGTAGTAELGVVDPIDKLSEITLKHSVWLHVDAAFGGLVIPFLNDSMHEFDFTVKGVTSITVDPHKMGMAAIPAGGILFRDSKALDYVKTETPYLTDKVQYTIAGTRPGASAASAWAVFNALGVEGFRKIVKDCMRNTCFFANGIKKAGFKLLIEPQLNIVAFRGPNTKQLAEKLRTQGWFVSYVPRYDCIRIVVMPHVKKRHAAAFLKDLKQ